MATFILLVIGGLNWLAVGVLGKDVSVFLGGMGAPVAKLIYILVGLSAIYEIATHKKNCMACMGPSKGPMSTPGSMQQ